MVNIVSSKLKGSIETKPSAGKEYTEKLHAFGANVIERVKGYFLQSHSFSKECSVLVLPSFSSLRQNIDIVNVDYNRSIMTVSLEGYSDLNNEWTLVKKTKQLHRKLKRALMKKEHLYIFSISEDEETIWITPGLAEEDRPLFNTKFADGSADISTTINSQNQ